MKILTRILLLFLLLLVIGCGEDDPVEPVNPSGVVAVNGEFYRLNPGDTALTPSLRFKVVDNKGSALSGQTVRFTLLEGDGAMSVDSATIGGNLFVELSYAFTDSVGHAVIKATSGSLDSTEVVLRKSMLIPGQVPQGQFILFSDTYRTIKAYNGEPDTLVIDPNEWWFHAVYESSLGVVFILEDVGQDSIASDNESILEIIVNDNEDLITNPDNDYKGTTRGGTGIGSTLADVVAEFGSPDDTLTDLIPPPAYWFYRWRSIALNVYTTYDADPAGRDTLDVREIHLFKPGLLPPLGPRRDYPHLSKDRQ